MAISGHKTRSVFDRYDIVSQRGLESAARKMEADASKRESQSGHKSVINGTPRSLAPVGNTN